MAAHTISEMAADDKLDSDRRADDAAAREREDGETQSSQEVADADVRAETRRAAACAARLAARALVASARAAPSSPGDSPREVGTASAGPPRNLRATHATENYGGGVPARRGYGIRADGDDGGRAGEGECDFGIAGGHGWSAAWAAEGSDCERSGSRGGGVPDFRY